MIYLNNKNDNEEFKKKLIVESPVATERLGSRSLITVLVIILIILIIITILYILESKNIIDIVSFI